MIESQRQLLESTTSNYLSLGITGDGEPRRSIAVPWERTANAFNMRTPDMWISPEDLSDPALWTALERFRVTGCYIFCPLEDYSFLTRLPLLQDIHICQGAGLKDLEFLRPMNDWFQLYIEDASLPTLTPLFPAGPRKGFHSYCVGLAGCTVGDISALEDREIYLSELVILVPKGTNERERWRTIRCGTYTYHEYRVPGA